MLSRKKRGPHQGLPFRASCHCVVSAECPQLIVPGSKDDLVNFYVDTATVRTKFGRLRRGVDMQQQV